MPQRLSAIMRSNPHNIYLRTDGMRAMTARLDFNIASSGVAIRVKEAGVANADISSDGVFWIYPAETSYRIFNVVPKTAGFSTFSVNGSGQISWGDGISPADVTLYRDTASWLRVGGNLYVDKNLTTVGHLTVSKPTGGIFDSTTISGFFGNPTGADNAYFIGNTLNGCYDYPVNNAALWVNFRGHAGGTAYTRSFIIGDGKGTPIAYFDGDTKTVGIGTQQPTARLDVIDGCIRARDGSNILPPSGAGVEVMMTGGVGYITAWDRGTATGRPMHFFASSYVFNNAAIRCDSGFNVGGNAGFSGTIPPGRDIYVSGGIITGHS